MTGELLVGAGAFILFVFIAFAIGDTLLNSKSQKYRKYLTDMYVAAKVRDLSKEDGLDLDIEQINFKRYARKLSNEEKDLDKTIEEDLKERVGETYEKEKKSKK